MSTEACDPERVPQAILTRRLRFERPCRLDLLLVAAVALIFGRSVGFALTNWDDYQAISGNPLVQAPLSDGWRALLLTPNLGYPQPLTILSYHLDFLVSRGAAWSFHLTNLILHAGNALLVRRLGHSYGLSIRWSFLAALGFALHPLAAEPVCWATGRKDLLAAFAVLACIRLHRQSRDALTAPRAALILGLFALGLCSKPIAIVAPFLIIVEYLARQTPPGRVGWALLAVMAVLAALDVALAMPGQQQAGALLEPRSAEQTLRFVTQHWALQVRNWLAPFWLSPLYFEFLPEDWLSAWGVAGMLVTLATVVCVCAAWRDGGAMRTLVLWPLITFVPSSGLVALTRGPADSYLYLPLVGLTLTVGHVAARIAPRNPHATISGAAILVTAYAAIAAVQASIWSTSSALWRSVVARYPNQPSAHQNLGDALLLERRPGEALPHLERALELLPGALADPEGLRAIADACALLERPACAVRWYATIVERHGSSPAVAFRLMAVYTEAPLLVHRNQWQVAQSTVRRVLENITGGQLRADCAFFEYLAQDAIPMPALHLLASDAEVGASARELLALYQSSPLTHPECAPRDRHNAGSNQSSGY